MGTKKKTVKKAPVKKTAKKATKKKVAKKSVKAQPVASAITSFYDDENEDNGFYISSEI